MWFSLSKKGHCLFLYNCKLSRPEGRRNGDQFAVNTDYRSVWNGLFQFIEIDHMLLLIGVCDSVENQL